MKKLLVMFVLLTIINYGQVKQDVDKVDSLKTELNENIELEKWLNNQLNILQSQIYKLKSDILDLKERQEVIIKNRNEVLKKRSFIQAEIDKFRLNLDNKKEK